VKILRFQYDGVSTHHEIHKTLSNLMIRYCNSRSYHELYTCVPSVESTLGIPKTVVGWMAKLILFGGPKFEF